MNDLIENIAIGSPFIWVRTDEPHRIYEMVMAADSRRKLYRMDILDGFVQWDRAQAKWLKVLIPSADPDGLAYPTPQLTVAIDYLLNDPGIMFMEHAHLEIPSLISFLTAINWKFLNAVRTDTAELHPLQFVCMSHENNIPAEIKRIAVLVNHELPDEEALGITVDGLITAREGEHSPRAAVVRAAKGMTEAELISAGLLSMREKGHLNAEAVNEAKLAKIKADGLLEVSDPKIDLDGIGGLDNAKRLITNIAWIWNDPETANSIGIQPLHKILLVGVPGTGKSALCEATAKTLGLQLGKGGISAAMNKFIGESEANIRRMFAQLRAMAPIVFWMDEYGREMSGSQSSNVTDGGTTDRTHGEFLTEVQKLGQNILLMAAANRIEDLPPEMLRADRFDKILFVGFPTFVERLDIFSIHLGKHVSDYDLPLLAEATDLFTGAEIKQLIKESYFNIGCEHKRIPTTDEIIAQARRMKNRVWIQNKDAIKSMYEKAQNDWEWASSEQEKEAASIINGKSARHRRVGGVRDVTDEYKEKPGAIVSTGGLGTFFDRSN